jgi:hypothetical protein
MIGIKYIEKGIDTPNGQVIGQMFEEASWIYGENELPFVFEIFKNSESILSSNLYPNGWASWHILDNDSFTAVIKNKKGDIISKFNLDIWTNRNATEQFFDTWIGKNPNSNGIVIGTHDGTEGEWVKHIKNNSANAVLVEASDKQFKELTKNYLNFNNVKFRKNVIPQKYLDLNINAFELGHG